MWPTDDPEESIVRLFPPFLERKPTMGWTFSKDWNLRDKVVAYLVLSYKPTEHYLHSESNQLWMILDCANGCGANPQPHRVIAVALLEWGGPDTGWGYKSMSVECGPYAYDCPPDWLDRVPVPEEPEGWTYAREWYARARRHHDEKKAAQAAR